MCLSVPHAGCDPAAVQVQWEGMPKGYTQVVPMAPRTTASSHRLFPLNYVARPGDPVTVMTARKGLRVTPNPPVLMQRMQRQKQQAYPGRPDGEQEAEQQEQQEQQQRGVSHTKEAQSGVAAGTAAPAAAAAAAVVPVGTLVQPCEMDEGCVWWTVDWGAGDDDGVLYQVGTTHADPCEMQVGQRRKALAFLQCVVSVSLAACIAR